VFPYDDRIARAVASPAQSIADVLDAMETSDALSIDGDGLKWFNWLYWHVTQAVKARVNARDFADMTWLTEIDVQFANLYFQALHGYLTGAGVPDCWRAFFAVRNDVRIARVQFALAGVNAHINHDLPGAIVRTCEATKTVPRRDAPQYADYVSVNPTLDSLIEKAKAALHVRLLGDPLPPVSHLEDTLAAWGTAAAREHAWNNAEVLWTLRGSEALSDAFIGSLDGITTFAGKALLVPVPLALAANAS
jgi:hypothetical protein